MSAELSVEDLKALVRTVPDFPKPEIVSGLGRVFKGQHVGYPGLEVGRAKMIKLEPGIAGTEILLDLDGEQPGRLPASFEVVPKALRLAVA